MCEDKREKGPHACNIFQCLMTNAVPVSCTDTNTSTNANTNTNTNTDIPNLA